MPTAVFTADVHLSRHDAERQGLWGRFLEGLRARASGGEEIELFVLGDLFEFWHEFLGRPHRRYAPVLEAIGSTVRSGIPVKLLAGNRDWLYGRGMAATGAEFLGNSIETDICGLRVYVSHGDELCTRDWSYQAWRRIARSWPLRALLGLTPRVVSFGLADLGMRLSKAHQRYKGLEALDIQASAAEGVAARGFDLVICGHVHVKGWRQLRPEGREAELITLPAWDGDEPVEVLELTSEGARFVDPFGGGGGGAGGAGG